MFHITWHMDPCDELPAGGSDTIGADFATVDAANREIDEIRKDAGACGYADWLSKASLWVTDDNGNIY